MLTSKNPAAGDVVSIRLTSTDEIVGRFVEQDATTVVLSKVIAVQIHMVAPGQAGLAFAPFMSSTDDAGNTSIYRSAMLTPPMKTRSDVAAKYTEATSSIAIPTAQQASSILKP